MRIAVFTPNWIGDVVMATPAMTALRRAFPAAKLVGVMKPYVAGVLDGMTWFDETVPAQGAMTTAKRLRGLDVDWAVLFPNSFRSALTAWLGGAKRIIGYARDKRSWLLTDKLPTLKNADGSYAIAPVIDAYNRLVTHLDCPDPGYRMRLGVTAPAEAAAEHLWRHYRLKERPFVVCLNPGAAYGAAKLWPAGHFAAVARRWADEYGAGVLVLCGPNERALAGEIAARAERPQVCSLAAEPVSLGLLKACVKKADLLITTDSGPRHFAAAFDKPVVTLFGPTHIGWTETHHPCAVHLQKPVPCGPCQLRTCPLEHQCMRELGPDEVFAAAVRLRDAGQKQAA